MQHNKCKQITMLEMRDEIIKFSVGYAYCIWRYFAIVKCHIVIDLVGMLLTDDGLHKNHTMHIQLHQRTPTTHRITIIDSILNNVLVLCHHPPTLWFLFEFYK